MSHHFSQAATIMAFRLRVAQPSYTQGRQQRLSYHLGSVVRPYPAARFNAPQLLVTSLFLSPCNAMLAPSLCCVPLGVPGCPGSHGKSFGQSLGSTRPHGDCRRAPTNPRNSAMPKPPGFTAACVIKFTEKGPAVRL